MTSAIDPTKPTQGQAYTADVRANFAAAHEEISALQDQIAALQDAIDVLKARQMSAASVQIINPPNTTSSEFVTAGIGVQFTPSDSTRGIVMVQGELGNTQNASISELQICYGEGTAPDFGSLLSETNGQLIGTVVGMMSSRAGDYGPFAAQAYLEELVPETLYWIGVAFRAESGTATLSQMSLIAFEVLDAIT